MKFKKAVLIKIADTHFDPKYWSQIDAMVEKRVSLTIDNPKLKDELKDCDCLLLGFQVPVGEDILVAAPNLKYIGIFFIFPLALYTLGQNLPSILYHICL